MDKDRQYSLIKPLNQSEEGLCARLNGTKELLLREGP
jgi:hypothetical protein